MRCLWCCGRKSQLTVVRTQRWESRRRINTQRCQNNHNVTLRSCRRITPIGHRSTRWAFTRAESYRPTHSTRWNSAAKWVATSESRREAYQQRKYRPQPSIHQCGARKPTCLTAFLSQAWYHKRIEATKYRLRICTYVVIIQRQPYPRWCIRRLDLRACLNRSRLKQSSLAATSESRGATTLIVARRRLWSANAM